MELHAIETGNFKLDGGAMFGVVPKSIWNRLNPADENNMCTWAMRCLLVRRGNRLLLIDNGIGQKQDDKFFSHYYLHGDANLFRSIRALGYEPSDITDVLLTHLHFDHCGGSVGWNKDHSGFEMNFPNATYWSDSKHWEWAVKPNAREKASFLKENILPIQESGHLKFADRDGFNFEGINLHHFNGHTESMMVPEIEYKGKSIFFCADLLPSQYHIPIPYVMAYDVRPLESLKEKVDFLEMVYKKNGHLIFEHDPFTEGADLEKTEKGIRIGQPFKLKEL